MSLRLVKTETSTGLIVDPTLMSKDLLEQIEAGSYRSALYKEVCPKCGRSVTGHPFLLGAPTLYQMCSLELVHA